jgi:hypothetical protein
VTDSNTPGGLPPPPPPMGAQRASNPPNQPRSDEQQAQDLTASIHEQQPTQRMPPPPAQTAQPQAPPQSPAPAMPAPSTPPPAQQTPYSPPQPQMGFREPPKHQTHTSSAAGDISTEEYVEAVIEERWADIENDIRKVVEWKNRSDQRITQLNQQFNDLKDRFDKLHAALIGKIESYDKNILEVGAELKAMEKVFGKIMPAFTENVKQLDDMTRRLQKD